MTTAEGGPWLITGGAGYIGAHVLDRIIETGGRALVIDDLSTGDAGRVPDEVPFLRAPLSDLPALRALLESERPVGVIHLAARKSPTESVADPLAYAKQNVGGLISLLDAMHGAGVNRMVFSSSCSVYGEVGTDRVTEDRPLQPISPYGESKAYGERLLAAMAATRGLRVIALRYFNVAGAAAAHLGDASDFNLVPNVLRAAATGTPVAVFGSDYDTPDGSCVRDYLDVRDLAEAHLTAAAAIDEGPAFRAFNVGTGCGVSVLQMLEAAARATGRSIPHLERERRPGDPSSIVAAVERIAGELGWRSRYSLDETLNSAWRAFMAAERSS